MDEERFWQLIEEARTRAGADARTGADPAAQDIAGQASALLARLPPADIARAQQVLWDLLAQSYRSPLWAAAYLINGGCSDDGFDYFRGWLITRGRAAFERALADPDSLAGLPAVAAAVAEGLECEDTLDIVWQAYRAATGTELPDGSLTISYPDLDPEWDFDFDDEEEITRRLPALAVLCLT
ncbi:DUF4240 domain-containing protein [Streptomyces sp. NPDC059917]|uniref:DUF4240 domain-containing protein n=1 Tax=Streptomyces sp. NPDC059917 TaxID=3347002 RepID=UPI0036619610